MACRPLSAPRSAARTCRLSALPGDGAFGIAVNELTAIGRGEWPAITQIVFRNYQWGAEKRNSTLWFDDNFVGTELDTQVSYAGIAQACGLKGVVARTQDELTDALRHRNAKTRRTVHNHSDRSHDQPRAGRTLPSRRDEETRRRCWHQQRRHASAKSLSNDRDKAGAMTKTPIELLRSIAPATRPVVSLCEGTDPRVVAGAVAAHNADLADIILVGPEADVRAELERCGAQTGGGIEVHDPATSSLTQEFAEAYFELRKAKGVDETAARAAAENPLVYAAMLVRRGYAHGTVGGAVATTGDIVRTAIQVIGTAPEAPMVSSFFLMYPPADAPTGARAMLYSDCGLVIDPSSEQLAAIATASAASCRALLRVEPKLAMLSFSTMGSARHAAVDKVTEGLRILQETQPDLDVDGDLQFDAAFVPSVAERKAPGSKVAGLANVMIFPNLDAGNIAYKITQRVGGYSAIGPVLQGLNKPANDLSRGCSADDVTQMIAVTILQADIK